MRAAPAAPRPGAALSPPTSSMEQSWGAAWGHHRHCNWRTPTMPIHIPSPVVWQILAVALLMYLLCGSNVPGCSDCTWRSVFAKPWCCRGGVPTSPSQFPALQLWAHDKSQPVVHQLQTELQYKRAVQLSCVWTKQALRKREKPTLLSEIRRQKVNWETPPLSARDDSRASQTGAR